MLPQLPKILQANKSRLVVRGKVSAGVRGKVRVRVRFRVRIMVSV